MHVNEDVIEQRFEVREVVMISTGRVFQAEGMANAKALGWECLVCWRKNKTSGTGVELGKRKAEAVFREGRAGRQAI